MSTSLPIALVPAQTEWCDEACAKSRGIMSFNGRQPLGLDVESESWEEAGVFNLPFSSDSMHWWSQSLLLPGGSNSTVRGDWGLTNVGLGLASKQSITITEQFVARHYSEDFFLGYLGLSVGDISLNGATRPTYLSGLAKNPVTIPSSAYGFTAGASYSKSYPQSWQ